MTIKSSMILEKYDKLHYVMCASNDCKLNSNDFHIPHYYSQQQAKDEDWHYTKDIMFCPPDTDGVWVCPECSKGYF